MSNEFDNTANGSPGNVQLYSGMDRLPIMLKKFGGWLNIYYAEKNGVRYIQGHLVNIFKNL